MRRKYFHGDYFSKVHKAAIYIGILKVLNEFIVNYAAIITSV